MRTFALYPIRLLGAVVVAALFLLCSAALALWCVARYAADPLATVDEIVEGTDHLDTPVVAFIRAHRERLIEEIGC